MASPYQVRELKRAVNAWTTHHVRDLLGPIHVDSTLDVHTGKVVLRALYYLGVGLPTIRRWEKRFTDEAVLSATDWLRHPSHFTDHHRFAKPVSVARIAAERLKRLPKRAQHISGVGTAFIAEFEGFEPTYVDDGFGNPTVGFGHVERGVKTPISRQQGLALLRKDLRRYEQGVLTRIHRPLKQGQLDALVSFAFNLGPGALDDGIAARINNGNLEGAEQLWLQYDHANGQQVPGLSRRRRAELAMFKGA